MLHSERIRYAHSGHTATQQNQPSTGQTQRMRMALLQAAHTLVQLLLNRRNAHSAGALSRCCKRSCLCCNCLLDWALAVLDAGDGCRHNQTQAAGSTAKAVKQSQKTKGQHAHCIHHTCAHHISLSIAAADTYTDFNTHPKASQRGHALSALPSATNASICKCEFHSPSL